LALTAYVTEEDRRRALASGFQMHVGKPADPSELLDKVAILAGKLADQGTSSAGVSFEAQSERRRGPTR
jgi:CheY-like chemotaxis protein